MGPGAAVWANGACGERREKNSKCHLQFLSVKQGKARRMSGAIINYLVHLQGIHPLIVSAARFFVL